jgi:cold shock protein
MGRGNDHRDRRRGRDDQPSDPWGGGDYTPPPSSFDRPRPRTGGFSGAPSGPAAGGPETEAKVKWFNGEKGFGFVELTDGSGEAFLHIRPVEAAGFSALESGTTLVVRVGPGQRGPQVTEVVSVDTSTADPSAGRGGAGGFGGARRPPGGPGGPGGGFRDRDRGGDRGGFAPRQSFESSPAGPPDTSGTVKWYDPVKGFGFISVEGESKDLFVHRSVLERAGLRDLAEGERVRVAIVEGRKGREVGAIETA